MTYLDQIEKYLNGELSDEERIRFEERMKLNPRLAEDTDLYKELTGFLTKNAKSVDKLINTVDEVNYRVQRDEWNKPENAHLVDRISKIMVYMSDSIQFEIYHWLKTEAIIYPELINEILDGIDEYRFDNGFLGGEECLTLYDNLMSAYNSFTAINAVVDDFLLNKPLADNNNVKTIENHPLHHTRIYHLPNTNIEQRNKRKRTKFIFSIAASLALLIAAGTILWQIPSAQPSNDKLFSDFYSPYTVSIVQRSAATILSGDFNTGISNFSQGAYSAAIASFSNLSKTDVNYIPASFFMGISNMQVNHYASAADNFKEVLNSGNNNLAADAQWNLALCYLKLGNIEQTKKVLLATIASNPFYQEKALALLKKLPE